MTMTLAFLQNSLSFASTSYFLLTGAAGFDGPAASIAPAAASTAAEAAPASGTECEPDPTADRPDIPA